MKRRHHTRQAPTLDELLEHERRRVAARDRALFAVRAIAHAGRRRSTADEAMRNRSLVDDLRDALGAIELVANEELRALGG